MFHYIRAEQKLPAIAKEQKSDVIILGYATKQWISLPIISKSMYNDALVVCDVLWNNGYYVGMLQDTRRKDTWTLIACWDRSIVEHRSSPPVDFLFGGAVPANWK